MWYMWIIHMCAGTLACVYMVKATALCPLCPLVILSLVFWDRIFTEPRAFWYSYTDRSVSLWDPPVSGPCPHHTRVFLWSGDSQAQIFMLVQQVFYPLPHHSSYNRWFCCHSIFYFLGRSHTVFHIGNRNLSYYQQHKGHKIYTSTNRIKLSSNACPHFFSMIVILIGMKFSSGFPFWLLTLSIFVGPCLSSSENSLFQSFIHFKIHMFIFLPLPYGSFLCISDINFLPDTWFANIFSYFIGLLFLSPIDYFQYWAIYPILVLFPCNSTCLVAPPTHF